MVKQKVKEEKSKKGLIISLFIVSLIIVIISTFILMNIIQPEPSTSKNGEIFITANLWYVGLGALIILTEVLYIFGMLYHKYVNNDFCFANTYSLHWVSAKGMCLFLSAVTSFFCIAFKDIIIEILRNLSIITLVLIGTGIFFYMNYWIYKKITGE
jgi:hypothetical protein